MRADPTRTVRFAPAAVDIEIPAEFCQECAERLELCKLRRGGTLGVRGYCDHARVGVLVTLAVTGPQLKAWRDTPAYPYFKAVFRLSVTVDGVIVPEQRGALH
jgi:hypothetical protein